ncbi:GatB/YqeY domain-containing protein [Stereum hirsutum FP-91666 SS1]|uniref:GatB/YqeY domain-containing protein n=1 Tax=Stereum hirsutum (strain FP-91666) TaxID=721885 RepID=UPI0004449AC2|nr:GatB/YqeY domain-containing protein [Stereum hirsutum FP-91666 SS1]EIM82982.1 GatB/YqeY domain-containing protein [Stereum hirsutum FP-91666 SS1]
MRSKDTVTSTTIRSILAEVYAADKKANDEKISSSSIAALIKKATARRAESAKQFTQASREDLAEKEQREVDLLATYLPPLLSEAEVDAALKAALSEQGHPQGDSRKAMGLLFKTFYSKVDKSTVDPDLVKRRAEVLLSQSQ